MFVCVAGHRAAGVHQPVEPASVRGGAGGPGLPGQLAGHGGAEERQGGGDQPEAVGL